MSEADIRDAIRLIREQELAHVDARGPALVPVWRHVLGWFTLA